MLHMVLKRAEEAWPLLARPPVRLHGPPVWGAKRAAGEWWARMAGVKFLLFHRLKGGGLLVCSSMGVGEGEISSV